MIYVYCLSNGTSRGAVKKLFADDVLNGKIKYLNCVKIFIYCDVTVHSAYKVKQTQVNKIHSLFERKASRHFCDLK